MSRSRAVRAGWTGVVGGCAAVAAAYLVGVCTTVGRRFDAAVVARAEQASWPVRDAVHAILSFATGPAAVVVLAATAVGSWRHGRVDVAVRVIGLVVGAETVTEVIKVVLPRPGGENTLPSGHVTLLGAVAVAGLIALPRRRRRLWSVIATPVVGLAAVGTWVIGWHRPSDVVAAVGVVACCGGVSELLAARRRSRRHGVTRPTGRRLVPPPGLPGTRCRRWTGPPDLGARSLPVPVPPRIHLAYITVT